MAWQLKWARHVKALERQAKRGKKIAALASRPKLRIVDIPYTDAFGSLSAARTWGAAAPNPIPIAEVAAYCSLAGIASQPARLKYLHLIQLLDQVYIAHHADAGSSSSPRAGVENNNKS